MSDVEGKIAEYLRHCRELAIEEGREDCPQWDGLAFDILEEKAREVIIGIRFVEVVSDARESLVRGQVDRYGMLRFELDEFGEIIAVTRC